MSREYILKTEVLRRLFPCEEVRQRSINGANLLDKGKILRITSDAIRHINTTMLN